MGAAARVSVRLAEPVDIARCLAEDRHLPEAVIQRKVESREVLLADVDGHPAGYLRLEYLWSKIPYIGLICVQEKHRKRGIGRAMLGFLEAFLRERGHRLLLSSSQADEPASQAWHRAAGFRECGILA